MVAERAILILLLLLLPVRAMAEGSCGTCHSPHYTAFGNCTSCHRGDPRTDRTDLAHATLIRARYAYFALPDSLVTQYGKQLIDQAGCRRCHQSGGKGNGLASNLDQLQPDVRPEDLMRAIRQPGLFMPDFFFAEAAAVSLVNALLSHAAKAERQVSENPLLVYFEGVKRDENPFDEHCGGCHRLLTKHWGGLGRGAIGPNLSGLFSEFYPSRFGINERWSRRNLEKWLKNPREIRKMARMVPQRLLPDKLSKVFVFFEIDQPHGVQDKPGSDPERVP